MFKIKKLTYVPKTISGNRVVVSEKILSGMITTINQQSEVINQILDHLETENIKLENVSKSVQALAKAINNLKEI